MSSQPKIMVLHLKELIYTGIFVVLGIVLILLLMFMFFSKDPQSSKPASQSEETSAPAEYTAGVYSTCIADMPIELQIVVDADCIHSLQLVPLQESVETMYPLVPHVLSDMKQQLQDGVAIDHIISSENPYTYSLLLDSLKCIVEKARPNS